MRGFSGFDAVIRQWGGIASRRELIGAGWTADEIRFGQYYRRLDRIRNGWYASEDLPDDARAAWRAGGPLACISALLHHGVLGDSATRRPSAARNGTARQDAARRGIVFAPLPLHICIPLDGHLPKGSQPGAIVHWSTIDWHSGSRRAVSPSTALRQARRCAPMLLNDLGIAG